MDILFSNRRNRKEGSSDRSQASSKPGKASSIRSEVLRTLVQYSALQFHWGGPIAPGSALQPCPFSLAEPIPSLSSLNNLQFHSSLFLKDNTFAALLHSQFPLVSAGSFCSHSPICISSFCREGLDLWFTFMQILPNAYSATSSVFS